LRAGNREKFRQQGRARWIQDQFSQIQMLLGATT
jgi:hypothetical protein